MLGGATAKKLDDHLGLRTVDDLLRHYPRRYAARGELTDRSTRCASTSTSPCMARVLTAVNKEYGKPDPRRRRRPVRTEVVVTDGTGELLLTFFKQAWRAGQLKAGTIGLFAGKVGSSTAGASSCTPSARCSTATRPRATG